MRTENSNLFKITQLSDDRHHKELKYSNSYPLSTISPQFHPVANVISSPDPLQNYSEI